MAKIDISEAELNGLVEEVLQRLARDPAAAHLWHWVARPGCSDEPPGPSRRGHLTSLLGLLGAAAVPGLAACESTTAGPVDAARRGEPTTRADLKLDRPSSSADHSGQDAPRKDGPATQPDKPPTKDKPSIKSDRVLCADDPCSCADDPCS